MKKRHACQNCILVCLRYIPEKMVVPSNVKIYWKFSDSERNKSGLFAKKKLTWLMNLHSTWPDKRYRSLFWVETTTLLWIFLDQERKNTGLDRIFLVEVLKLHSTPRMDLRRKKWFSKYLISQFISDFRRKFFQSVSGHFFRSAVKNAIYASRGSFWETNTFWKKIPFVCFPEMSEKN